METILENPVATAANEVSLNWHFHPKQSAALDILMESADAELVELFGGAKGPGKSTMGCRWVLLDALSLIQKYGLRPSEDPLPIGFMGRNRATDFVKTTLETWKREIPRRLYRINEQKHEIIIAETVKFFYGGFDNREAIEKFNSAEFCRFFVDQAEECSKGDIALLRATFRLKINGWIPTYRGLLTANPRQCWLKQDFVKNPQGKNSNYFVPALPKDNPDLPPGYFDTLKKSFAGRPELIAAYIDGSWDAITGTDTIILDKWVEASHNQKFIGSVKHKFVVADIARFGDDRMPIAYMEETDTKELEVYGQKSADTAVRLIGEMANRHNLEDGKPPTIIIDGDGIGGPVADFLRKQGFDVYEIHSAAEASDKTRFYNRRAEMWWTAGEAYQRGEIFESYEGEYREAMERELTIPRYDLRDGRILVESKEEIKKPDRYGQSPDLGDMRIYGLWGRRFARIPQLKNKDRDRSKTSPMNLSPMAV
jgi:hypothetical protein